MGSETLAIFPDFLTATSMSTERSSGTEYWHDHMSSWSSQHSPSGVSETSQ